VWKKDMKKSNIVEGCRKGNEKKKQGGPEKSLHQKNKKWDI